MVRSALDYLRMLYSLLPTGRAWTRDASSRLYQLLSAFADELARVDSRASDLLIESDVRRTTEIIEEHETDYGLPEEGQDLASTIEERRQDLFAKLALLGSQREVYFEEVASNLGYDAYIEYYPPFWADYSGVGDTIGAQDNIFSWLMRVSMNVQLGEFDLAFSLAFDRPDIHADSYYQQLVKNFDYLIFWINKIKPAHHQAFFDWFGGAFNRAFGFMFNAFPTYDGDAYPMSFGSAYGSSFAILSYSGSYLVGPFDSGFTLAYDAHFGGDFERTAFDSDFHYST